MIAEMQTIICKNLEKIKVELPLFQGLVEQIDILLEATLIRVLHGILNLILVKTSKVASATSVTNL